MNGNQLLLLLLRARATVIGPESAGQCNSHLPACKQSYQQVQSESQVGACVFLP